MKKSLSTKYNFILGTVVIFNISCNAPTEKGVDMEVPIEVMQEDATATELIVEPIVDKDSIKVDTLTVSADVIESSAPIKEKKPTEAFEKKGNAIIHKSKDQTLIDSIKAEKNKYK
ncbi:hypothetical protein [Crocinitomix catalasitica]|uniref:hypothetical protein n=1 Tax=Crocinitomix catalasitica TaxID=184607 RepID=UPI000482EF05|nr:hypothetical protein [Crocinitomix catalasitica]